MGYVNQRTGKRLSDGTESGYPLYDEKTGKQESKTKNGRTYYLYIDRYSGEMYWEDTNGNREAYNPLTDSQFGVPIGGYNPQRKDEQKGCEPPRCCYDFNEFWKKFAEPNGGDYDEYYQYYENDDEQKGVVTTTQIEHPSWKLLGKLAYIKNIDKWFQIVELCGVQYVCEKNPSTNCLSDSATRQGASDISTPPDTMQSNTAKASIAGCPCDCYEVKKQKTLYLSKNQNGQPVKIKVKKTVCKPVDKKSTYNWDCDKELKNLEQSLNKGSYTKSGQTGIVYQGGFVGSPGKEV